MNNVRADHSSSTTITDNSRTNTVTIKKSNFVFGIVIVSVVVIALVFVAFILPNSKGSANKITGDWSGSGTRLSIYSDGTYEKNNEYGTGHYSILDDGRIKFTDYYGESNVMYYTVTSDTLTLSSSKDSEGITLTRK